MKFSTAVHTIVDALAVVLILLSGTANSQAVFRGHYEIKVTWGSSASRVTLSYEVTAGETVRADVGDDTLLISVQPLSDREYSLQLAVAHDSGAGFAVPASSNARRAAFNEVLELTETSDAVSLPGGILVSVLKLWE